jgi:hypothetical protein
MAAGEIIFFNRSKENNNPLPKLIGGEVLNQIITNNTIAYSRGKPYYFEIISGKNLGFFLSKKILGILFPCMNINYY